MPGWLVDRISQVKARRALRVYSLGGWYLTVIVVDLHEVVKAFLLLQEVERSRLGGLLFQGPVHSLVSAVLLGVTGLDAFDGDTET